MLDQHATFRQELKRAQLFLKTVKAHHDRMSPTDSTISKADAPQHVPESDAPQQVSVDDLLQHVSVAFEDIPEDAHESVRVVLMHPAKDTSLRQQVVDLATNVAGGAWGDIENITSRLSCLHMLSSLSIQSPYTYRVDGRAIRGSRPTPDKLRRLHAGGCRATVNLCREMASGDDDLIGSAGLQGEMTTKHVPIIDNTPPTADDVNELLAYLERLDGMAYVHCEAGVGRTGVMMACYRMAQGWTLANALHEARQFGCAMPDQLAFIEDWAAAREIESSPLITQPSDQVLRQTAAMNRDPVGLDRALA